MKITYGVLLYFEQGDIFVINLSKNRVYKTKKRLNTMIKNPVYFMSYDEYDRNLYLCCKTNLDQWEIVKVRLMDLLPFELCLIPVVHTYATNLMYQHRITVPFEIIDLIVKYSKSTKTI